MSRPRAADDFATIRARMEELRREREADSADGEARERPARPGRTESVAERARRARMEGAPPPWVPTIFVRRPRF